MMEQFPKLVASRLARLQQSPAAAVHPDADALTAFAENRLASNERKPVLAHLAICSHCREVLALVTGDAPLPVRKANTFSLRNLSWAAAFAVACLVTAVISRRPATTTPVPLHVPEITQLAAPADRAVAAPAVLPQPKPAATKKKAVPLRTFVPPEQVNVKPPIHENLPAAPELVSAQPATLEPQSFSREVPKAMPPIAKAPNTTFGFLPLRGSANAAAPVFRLRSLWRLNDTPGILLASNDRGQTWRSVIVDGQTSFQALSVAGWEIWAGGEAGILFHSTDNGVHWSQVTVSDGVTQLKDTITAIQTPDPRMIRIKTKSAEWLSIDGGATWVTK